LAAAQLEGTAAVRVSVGPIALRYDAQRLLLRGEVEASHGRNNRDQ